MLRILKRRKLFLGWTNIMRTSEVRLASTVLKTRPAFNDSSNPTMANQWEKENIGVSIARLEENVARNHKISKHYLEMLLNFPKVNPTNQMILSLIPCFGQMASSDPPEVRIDYINKVWNKLRESGVKLNVGHYNELLRVYLENDYKFSPSKILEQMEEDNIKPNRLTYKYLLSRFCREGDLSAVSSILKEMKEESIFFNESIFNELIMGYCVAKDLEGANSIMKIMEEKNLEVGSSTYTAYLCGLAMSGDIENFNSFFNKCSEDKIVFKSEQLLDIVYYLVLNEHTAVALEIINNYMTILNKSFFQLFFRLLNKKQYDSCFQIYKISSVKEEAEIRQPENLICRYVAENEPLENIKKMVNDWEQKGYGSNLMLKILFYTLKRKDLFKKSLSILEEFRERGQPVKEIYFWPMLAVAIRENSPKEIVDVMKIMNNDFGFSFTKTFLQKNIFNLLDQHSSDLVMEELRKLKLPQMHVRNAFLMSCMEKHRVDEFYKNSEFIFVPKDINRVKAFLVHCNEARSPQLVVNLLKNICASAIKNPYNGVELDESLDGETYDISKIPQDAIDNIVKNLVTHTFPSKNDFMRTLFEEMLSSKIRISKTTGDVIKETINDPELGDVVDKLTELPPIDVSQYLISTNNQTANKERSGVESVYHFLNYCNLGKIDEAEKLFKEHPDIQDNYFEKFVITLKRKKNEEKLDEYLKQFVNKIREGNVIRAGLFLQNELLQKGYIKEVSTLWSNFQKRSSRRRTIKKMLSSVLNGASWDDIVELVYPSNGGKGVVTAGEIIYFYGKNKNLDKILNILEKLEVDNFRNIELGRNLIIPLISEGETDMVKKIIAFLESKIPFSNVGPELMLAYACIGDVEKARECLAKEKIKTCRIFLLVSEIQFGKHRIEILENILNVLKGSKETEIQALLYESLMEDYEKEKVDPNKGLALWEQMQEFHIVPTAPFMGYLARLLKSNNMPIPFDDSLLDQEEWLLESNLPRALLRDLLDQFHHGEARGLSLVIEEGVKTGSINASTIQRMLKSVDLKDDKREMKNNLRYCLSLAEYKQAFNEGRLLKYVKIITNSSDPEVILNNIPHSFLVDCLMTERFDRIPSEVATVIMWACCYVVFKDIELSKMYKEKVRNSITDRTVLEGVLKFAPYLTHKRKIVNFLVAEGIFAQVGLDKEVNYVMNMANTPTKAKQIHLTNGGDRSGAIEVSYRKKRGGIDKEDAERTDNGQALAEVAPEANANEMNLEEEAKAGPASSGSV